jgi:hypothetical protein
MKRSLLEHPDRRGTLVRLLAGLGFALGLSAAPAGAQTGATLVIGVSNFDSGAPVTDADVILGDAKLHARTDSTGRARFRNLPKGFYTLRVRRLGYAAVDMRMAVQTDSSSMDVMLRPAAADLDTVHVVASAITTEQHRQFEQRRSRGIGRFLGPDDLARERYVEFPIVATQHFPGLGLVVGRAGQFQLASNHGSCGVDTTFEPSGSMGVMRSEQQGAKMVGAGSGARQTAADAATSPSSCFSDHPCHVKLFLDDQPVAETDINIVHTSDLYGVEYYSTGNAPPRYQVSGAACGVILLWTKAGNSG